MYVCVNERTSEVGAGSDRERCDGCSCVHVPCVCVCVCVCVYDISTLYIYIYICILSLSLARALSVWCFVGARSCRDCRDDVSRCEWRAIMCFAQSADLCLGIFWCGRAEGGHWRDKGRL